MSPLSMKGKMSDAASPTQTLRNVPIPEVMSRETPDMEEETIKAHSPQYY